MASCKQQQESLYARTRSSIGRFSRVHPLWWLLIHRLFLGIFILWVVTVLIFVATAVLPGDAAVAILGQNATPAALSSLKQQLHLDDPLSMQYAKWISGVLTGDFGHSLANGASVARILGPRLLNSAILVALSGLLGCALGLALGALCAYKEGSKLDHALSTIALALASLPEFVVAILLILLLSTGVFHWLPAISFVRPGEPIWSQPSSIVLPALSLVLVVCPYVLRMTRGTTVEALATDYAEMATLKGMSHGYVVLRHALPNALPAVAQVVGIIFLYLAGGIVVIEYVFNYPGIGAALVQAVQARDVPQIQAIVLILAAFYVLMNIVTDVWAVLMTPRRRFRR